MKLTRPSNEIRCEVKWVNETHKREERFHDLLRREVSALESIAASLAIIAKEYEPRIKCDTSKPTNKD
jgi:hypothetical protein